MSLQGRVALVTGVSRRAGIGFAVVRRLLHDGCSVFAQGWTPHDEAQAWGADRETEAALMELGGSVRYEERDFQDPEAPRAIVAARGRRSVMSICWS
jgi:3-oxoacyl-[acyl-carrier protein] reductase